jgi:hypothetical protein
MAYGLREVFSNNLFKYHISKGLRRIFATLLVSPAAVRNGCRHRLQAAAITAFRRQTL